MENHSYTQKELQQMIVETAMAYRFHNPYVQYDSTPICADQTGRCTSCDAPEMAEADTMVYSVCSNYMYDIFYDAFGYKLMGSPKGVLTIHMIRDLPATDPMVVYKYSPEDPDAEHDLETALRESRKLYQPGDMIVGYGSSGHVMMYVGDYFGDGKEYLAHCWGAKVDMTSGFDRVERAGAILYQTVDEMCYDPTAPNPNWCLAKEASHSKVGFAILRGINAKDFKPTPTPAALARVKYPGLELHRTLDRFRYMDAMPGETVTVTVSVKNNGKAAYRALPVTETVPAGQLLVSGSVTGGAEVKGDTIAWTVDVPAGQTRTMTYRITLQGKRGAWVSLPGGDADGLPLRDLRVYLGGKPFGEAEAEKLKSYAMARLWEEKGSFEELDILNRVYREALGIELGLPKTMQQLIDEYCVRSEPQIIDGEKVIFLNLAEPKDAAHRKALEMLIPEHFTGYSVPRDGDARRTVTEFAGMSANYRPGDIFFGIFGKNKAKVSKFDEQAYYIYLGGGKVLAYTPNGGFSVASYEDTIGISMRFHMMMALRPTLAHDELPG